jgi:hypothetical protein
MDEKNGLAKSIVGRAGRSLFDRDLRRLSIPLPCLANI